MKKIIRTAKDKSKVFNGCPKCGGLNSCCRVQSPDDLMHLATGETMTELWQCDECGNYFKMVWKLERLIELEEKGGR